jgi:hypothetical protein
VVVASAHSNDGQSDISGPLLLPPTIPMGSMTSEDRCYCGAPDMCVDFTSAQSSDGPSDINGPLVVPPLIATVRPFLLPPIAATGYMTSDDYC